MVIDVIELSKIIGALTVIFGFIVSIYKFVQVKILRRLDKLEKQMKKQYEINSERREELQIIIRGLLSCLKGLQELHCNGPVTEGIEEIENFILKEAHK